MDGIGTRLEGRAEDRVDREVALRSRGRTNPDRAIGRSDMAGMPIGVAEDGHRFDAQLPARPDDPDRDLAPVGNQHSSKRPTIRRHLAHLSLRKDARFKAGCCRASCAGSSSRLSASISNARISRGRVSDGMITAST